METEDRVRQVFRRLRTAVRSREKRSFLRDVRGQILEDDVLVALVAGSRPVPRPIVVSFDRRRRDAAFSYGRFDLVPEALDALAGGSGISRPVSGPRVLGWHGTRRGPRRILRRLARLDRELRFRRLLVMNFQNRPSVIGYAAVGGPPRPSRIGPHD